MMNTQIPEQLRKVRSASRSLQRFFILLLVLTVAGLLATLFGPEPPPVELAGITFGADAVTGRIQTLWILERALGAAIALKAFVHLIRLFGLYANGRIFTRDNVRQLRQLGITLVLLPVLWLGVFLAVVPEIRDMGDGWIRAMASFPMMAGLGGAIVILIAWIMDVGRELRDEHDLVI
jgi:hypothetical protein